jgi:FkbM family methyltransferase
LNKLKKLYEVGVGHLTVCYGALLWDDPNWDITMFEPHPAYYGQIKEAIKNKPNCKIYNVAIGDYDGDIEFFESETSSFVKGSASPILSHHKTSESDYKSFQVKISKISNFDKGDIDYLRLDSEGSEWFALKYLISRPEIINIETHSRDGKYMNPHFYEIEQWTKENNYIRQSIDHCDSVYRRNY